MGGGGVDCLAIRQRASTGQAGDRWMETLERALLAIHPLAPWISSEAGEKFPVIAKDGRGCIEEKETKRSTPMRHGGQRE